MESQFQLTNSKDIIAYLAQQFPNCFTLEGEAKPLKIGIFQDILSRLDSEALSKTKLRVALRGYTMSWRYLYSIKEGAHRIDLDGNPDEIISKEQMEYAQQQLKESKQKAKERLKERTQKEKRKNPRPPMKKAKTLKVGDYVKVILGNKPLKVQIINIEKEHIKVNVGSGMELTVKPEHIITK
ncbi:RNA chaperone ProQ [Gilliamella apicola]|uniref:RNA chaperone ProQ n=1 Tax=Gilliamella apicola TaxID=1196095 RepID=UPI002FEDF13C